MLKNRLIKNQTRLLGIEYLTALTGLCVLLLHLQFGVRLYLPNGRAALFSFEHYLAPLVGIALLSPFLQEASLQWPALKHRLRLVIALCLAVYAHFNFKLWAQLINPQLFDSVYIQADRQFSGLHLLCEAISNSFRNWLFIWPDAYHDVFVGMFVSSMLIHAHIGRRSLEYLVTVITAVLILGGLSYMIAPALGPFIYQANQSTAQHAMYAFHSTFIHSGGTVYQTGGFIMPLAAMPSLHIAHAFVLTWTAFRDCRILGWLYLPALLFLSTEAVASGWHYLVDIPAGLLVAAASLWLSSALLKHR